MAAMSVHAHVDEWSLRLVSKTWNRGSCRKLTVARVENLELKVSVGTDSRSVCSSDSRSSHRRIESPSACEIDGGVRGDEPPASVHSRAGLDVAASDARLLSCAAAPARYLAKYGLPFNPADSIAEVGDCSEAIAALAAWLRQLRRQTRVGERACYTKQKASRLAEEVARLRPTNS